MSSRAKNRKNLSEEEMDRFRKTGALIIITVYEKG